MASTPTEEQEWRRRLNGRHNAKFSRSMCDVTAFEFLGIKIKSFGHIIEANRMQDGRPTMRKTDAALPPRAPVCQVTFKYAPFGRDSQSSAPKHPAINRSKSLQYSTQCCVLIPTRADRLHVESQISEVLTGDIFDNKTLIRRGLRKHSSASSIIRKMNMANLTGTFGRRSTLRPLSYKTAGKDDTEVCGRAAMPSLLPEVELAIEAGSDRMLPKRHVTSNQADIHVYERDSTDTSTSQDGQQQMYSLAGLSECLWDFHSRDTMQSKPIVATAETSQHPMAHGIEDICKANPNKKINRDKIDNLHGSVKSALLLSEPRSCNLDFVPPSTAQLSIIDSKVRMMTTLAPQTAPFASTRQARQWLGRPLLHRKSFHLSPKAVKASG